jgi:hypothetical protein
VVISPGPPCRNCLHSFGEHMQVATSDGGRRIKCSALVDHGTFGQTCQCPGYLEQDSELPETLDDQIMKLLVSTGGASGQFLVARLEADGPTILAALLRLKEAGRLRLHFSALPVQVEVL